MNTTLNETTNSSQFDRTQRLDWLIPMVIDVILTVVVFWILLSLVHYGIQTGKWRKMQRSDPEKLNAGIVYSSLIVNAVVCLIFIILNLFFLNVGYAEGQDELCDQMFDAAGFTYGFVLITAVVFLWIRQRIFYTNRMLNVNYTKLVKTLSFVSIIIIAGIGIAVLTFDTLPDNNKSSVEGCHYMPDDQFTLAYALPGVLIIGFGHVTLLGLFIHALMHSSKSQMFNLCFCQSKNQNKRKDPVEVSIRAQTSEKHINIILWKSLTFAGISVVLDGTIQVVYFTVQPHIRIANTLFPISAFLNLLFLVFSFVHYKQMLFSFCYNRKMESHISVIGSV